MVGYKHKFINATPIDDELVVLDLLYREWGYRAGEKKLLHSRRNGWCEVEIAYHHDFSSSHIKYYQTTERVFDSLQKSGDIEGKPEWGYRSSFDFRISSQGEHRINAARDALTKGVDYYQILRSEQWFDQVKEIVKVDKVLVASSVQNG